VSDWTRSDFSGVEDGDAEIVRGALVEAHRDEEVTK
jgi:hypothetical protein